jgi:uncharacterized iron-regulated membrane protein
VQSGIRPVLLGIHRWLGLALAAFIILAGITGATLAFHDQLDAWLNPHLFHVEARAGRLSPLELRARAEQLVPEARIDHVVLRGGPEDAVMYYLGERTNPAAGESYPLASDQLFVDPYTGAELGRRQSSQIGLGREHFMEAVFRLHRYLLLGDTGSWILVFVAIPWLVSSLIGFYLTLPPRGRRSFSAWQPSWRVQWKAPLPRFSFDLHRATGLWLWPLLIIAALGAVRVTLGDTGLLDPLLNTVTTVYSPDAALEPHVQPIDEPPLSWEEALPLARRLMAERAPREGIEVHGEAGLSLDREAGLYVYSVRSSADAFDSGETELYFSAVDGRALDLVHPNRAAGNAISSWLGALHRARIGGTPYRTLVSLVGLASAALAITGCIVWYERRRPASRR